MLFAVILAATCCDAVWFGSLDFKARSSYPIEIDVHAVEVDGASCVELSRSDAERLVRIKNSSSTGSGTAGQKIIFYPPPTGWAAAYTRLNGNKFDVFQSAGFVMPEHSAKIEVTLVKIIGALGTTEALLEKIENGSPVYRVGTFNDVYGNQTITGGSADHPVNNIYLLQNAQYSLVNLVVKEKHIFLSSIGGQKILQLSKTLNFDANTNTLRSSSLILEDITIQPVTGAALGYLITFTRLGVKGSIKNNTVLDGNGGDSDCGIRIAGDAEVVMWGGSITGNKRGVNISNDGGSFTLRGGEIYNNKGAGDGCGVLVNTGEFNMTGGSIHDNGDLSNGGGGGVQLTKSVVMNMSGGEIYNNKAKGGGGVNIWKSSVFNMSGGKIYGNNAGVDGGGGVRMQDIYPDSSFTMTGGVIYGSDAPARLQNTALTSNSHALFIANGATFQYKNRSGIMTAIGAGSIIRAVTIEAGVTP